MHAQCLSTSYEIKLLFEDHVWLKSQPHELIIKVYCGDKCEGMQVEVVRLVRT